MPDQQQIVGFELDAFWALWHSSFSPGSPVTHFSIWNHFNKWSPLPRTLVRSKFSTFCKQNLGPHVKATYFDLLNKTQIIITLVLVLENLHLLVFNKVGTKVFNEDFKTYMGENITTY